jgi:hypothetical protein
VTCTVPRHTHRKFAASRPHATKQQALPLVLVLVLVLPPMAN